MIKRAVRQVLFAKKKSLILPPPTVLMTSNTAPAPFVVSASSELSGYEPWQAYDGSAVDGGATGVWASQSIPASITIDYRATYLVSAVEMTVRSIDNANQNPQAFDLQSSSDGVTFTTFASYTGQIWTNSETKTFTFAPIIARHLRIYYSLSGASGIVSIVLINWK